MLDTDPPEQIALLKFAIFTILVSLCVGCMKSENLDSTLEAALRLTDLHGTEAVETIENFELQWLSAETYTDPEHRSEVATGPYLDFWIGEESGESSKESVWLVRKAATVTRIRVIEYDSNRFKAVACLTMVDNRITSEGLFLETLSPAEQCGVYVFALESGAWKLIAYFYTNPPVEHVIRDWEQAPEWLKEIIGELPRDPSMLDEEYSN